MISFSRLIYWFAYLTSVDSVPAPLSPASNWQVSELWVGSVGDATIAHITRNGKNELLAWQKQKGLPILLDVVDVTGLPSFCFDPKRRIVYAQEGSGQIRGIDVKSRQPEFVLREGLSRISIIVASGDGRFLATYQPHDRYVQIWNLTKRRVAHRLPVPKSSFCQLAFAPTGEFFAFATGSEILIWSHEDERLEQTLRDDYGVHSIAFSPDGTKLAVGTGGKALDLNKWATGQMTDFKREFKAAATSGQTAIWDWAKRERRVLRDWTSPVKQVAFSSDGSTLWAASETPELYDFDSGWWTFWTFAPPESRKLPRHRKPGFLIGTHVDSGRLLMPPVPVPGGCTRMSLSPDGRYVGFVSGAAVGRILCVPGRRP